MKSAICPKKCEGLELQALIQKLKGGENLEVSPANPCLRRAVMIALGLVLLAGGFYLVSQLASQPDSDIANLPPDRGLAVHLPGSSILVEDVGLIAAPTGGIPAVDVLSATNTAAVTGALARIEQTVDSQAPLNVQAAPNSAIREKDLGQSALSFQTDSPGSPSSTPDNLVDSPRLAKSPDGLDNRPVATDNEVLPTLTKSEEYAFQLSNGSKTDVAETDVQEAAVEESIVEQAAAESAALSVGPPEVVDVESGVLAWLPLALLLGAALVLLSGLLLWRRRHQADQAVTVTLVPSASLSTLNRPEGATHWATPRNPGSSSSRRSRRGAVGLEADDLPGIRLLRTVGQGAQGVVWYGEIEATGEPVAIKLFNMQDKESGRTLLREVSLCSRVQHPHILNVILSDWASNYFVLVMEWVEGECLSPTLFPESRDKLECLRQLAHAIRSLDEAGIVHRDIKPANIMVRAADKHPILVDFGVAYDVRTRNLGKNTTSGTPFFMPPESFEDEQLPSHAFDAYALGMLALYLFDHLDMKEANAVPSLIQEKRNGSFANHLDGLIERLPSPPVQELVRGLVAEQPEARLATMGRVDELIDQAVAA